MTHIGTTAFLRQAHRNNWEQYLAALRPGVAQGWDICVLTASDERQAEMYRCQLNWRREAGLLPAGMHFLALPDPGGRRIGSGGATLNALAQVAGLVAENEGGRLDALQRVLLIHSGGDSKRLPHCSATGKLFARVPRVLPDGRASTIFDEFLISLSGLATQLPPGVLIASGDVLLIFDHLQLSLRRPGVIGVAAAAPAEMGLDHGVYVSGDGGHQVRAYLHKPSGEELNHWDGMHVDGTVQIDTGLVWLDATVAHKLVSLAWDETVAHAPLNLYGDLLLPLADSTTREGYLADESDGPATPAVKAARSVLWDRIRDIPFTVERLQPAVFVHFGTSREYWQMTADAPELADLCGWTLSAAAWDTGAGCGPAGPAVLINAAVERSISPQGQVEGQNRPLIVDSHLRGALSWSEAAIISGVQTSEPFQIGPDVVIDQMPIAGGRFVTRVFGLHDDPKLAWDASEATFMNRPWAEWLAAAGITSAQLWPHVAAGAQSLWNARLYPALPDRDQSLRLALVLQDPAMAWDGWRAAWQIAPRLSLAESAAQADGPRLLAELAALEDTIAVRRFCAAVEAEQPAFEIKALLGAVPAAVIRRSQRAAEVIIGSEPLLQLRGFQALAEATGEHAWEDRAFVTLAEMIERATLKRPQTMDHGPLPADYRPLTTPHLQPLYPVKPGMGAGVVHGPSSMVHRPVRVCAASRIDLGGGWTDTPPYSIERGGTVLNAALTLRGVHPIEAEAAWLPEPRLILVSRDLDTTLEPTRVGEVLAYARPGDPFSLHKAALVLRGIVRADADPEMELVDLLRGRGGLRLCTGTNIPFGSGLGTSSILAGAVLAALTALDAECSSFSPSTNSGQALHPVALFDEVLCLEQMLTTGGGWQDQVGGLTGGIKLVCTSPGLPQRITVTPVQLGTDVADQLGKRLLLVYTGQRRLAKNLLRTVMARWMARDPEMTWIQGEIARLAVTMRAALLAGDLGELGGLLAEHWILNKRMDPGCTNPFIDELFETMRPYICGGKLAGAGGGGFVIAIARSLEAAQALAAALAQRYPGTPVERWEAAVPADGLQVHLGS